MKHDKRSKAARNKRIYLLHRSGLTQQKVGEMEGITKQAVSRIVQRERVHRATPPGKPAKAKRRWVGRIYLGRDAEGKQLTKWVGRFDTRRERDAAVAEARVAHKRKGSIVLPLCDAYVDRYLAEVARRYKPSTHSTRSYELARFRKDFAGRSLGVSRADARDWVNGEGEWSKPVPRGSVRAVITLYNHAIDEDDLPLERNPFRGLTQKSEGRSKQAPPTEEEFTKLLEACSVHGSYAETLRSLILFATYTLMRPGELYALRWSDIDFETNRIHKARRLYKGHLDVPKTGERTIALTAPARNAIIGLRREGELVFRSKTDRRLSQETMRGYWKDVCKATGTKLVAADAGYVCPLHPEVTDTEESNCPECGLDFDFYHATKHYGVWYLWTQLGLSKRAIAAQAGWQETAVDEMLKVYGHSEVGALEEIDAAFARDVVRLRAVGSGTQS